MNNLTLVIPAKYEAGTLPIVLKELEKYKVKKVIVIPEYDEETHDAIKNFDCNIVKQKGEGFGSALIEGIETVKTKYLCIFNADGSFDPKYLSEMINLLENQNDFVFNTRYENKGGSDDDTFLTYIGNKFFTALCKVLFSLNISDVLFTYVMGRTNAFNHLKLRNKDFTFCIELPVKAKINNFRSIALPSYERSRISGRKKVNEFKDGFLILISIIKFIIIKK
ncbi:glycosyltransferase family 2 protein [Candidatus Pelagibacter sp.]|jgi:glycosyltransferase involved in cell wall biosynthesis|nr:glycosyltransferase family 2 protein [Candidatus Pelagibacter sp.]